MYNTSHQSVLRASGQAEGYKSYRASLFPHSDVENRDTVSWCYEGTVYPYGMTASSTPGEAGEAERSCPSAPTDEDAEVYIVLWQYPLAFASDTAPMDLTDREELSRALEDSPDSTAPRGYMVQRRPTPPPSPPHGYPPLRAAPLWCGWSGWRGCLRRLFNPRSSPWCGGGFWV